MMTTGGTRGKRRCAIRPGGLETKNHARREREQREDEGGN